MCTAITWLNGDFYFGRNLDLDHGYQETVAVTPRNYPFRFRQAGPLNHHYALLGMAYIQDGYPLYYEATNEKGLSMAGLNFVGNAVYHAPQPGKDNIAPFELIPWLLGQCADLTQAKALLSRLNVLDANFTPDLPAAQLHWLIASREGALTLESAADGLNLYDNPAGVLTNNPPFPFHQTNLTNYLNLTPHQPENRFSPQLQLTPCSLGMGAMGLPGDLSSVSRFIRAAFVKLNAVSGPSEAERVSQFFHILGSVEQQRGCVRLEGDRYEVTLYTSCCNADKGIYYYTTYDNHQITAIDLHREDLESSAVITHPMRQTPSIHMQN